jgi:tripartite ATP-independent transporter DctM subunit
MIVSNSLLLIVLFIGLLLGLYLLGVPVAFALGFTSILLMFSPFVPFQPQLVAQSVVSGSSSFVLLAIPLFLQTGIFMNEMGLTDDIFDFAGAIVGPIRGGLAHVNVIASIIFSGMTGTAAADAAGLGTVEYQAMQNADYDKGYSVAVTGASSIVGPIIPPSVPLIIYGVLAQVSIGALFIAGLVPGIMMGIGLMVICSYYAHINDYERGSWWSIKEFMGSFKRAAPALGTPVLIVGGILVGLFTPTEAGAAALFYTLFIGTVFYEQLDIETLISTLYDGMIQTAMITFIVATATLYGFLVRRAQLPEALANTIANITTNPIALLFLMVLY